MFHYSLRMQRQKGDIKGVKVWGKFQWGYTVNVPARPMRPKNAPEVKAAAMHVGLCLIPWLWMGVCTPSIEIRAGAFDAQIPICSAITPAPLPRA